MVAAQTARAAFFYARHNSRRGIMHFQVVLFTIRTPIHSSKKETSIVVEALEWRSDGRQLMNTIFNGTSSQK